MSNSISANDTADRTRKAVLDARYGTRHVANYLQPRNYYYAFSCVDDYMALQLLAIDQARLQCEKAIKSVSRDKSVYKGRLKQLATRLYKARGYTQLPICAEIEQSVLRNMTEDEIMAFGVMASHIDDLIQSDIDKLTYTLFNEVGRSGVRQQEAMTDILSAHLVCIIAEHIMERCEQQQKGAHYWLCLDPAESTSRDKAYYLSPKDCKRMRTITCQLLDELSKGQTFAIPYTQAMETSVTIICNKICDVVNIYNACIEAGVNVSAHSYQDLEAIVERIKAKKEEAMRPQSIEDSKTIERAADAFAAKGWNVKSVKN